MQDLAVGLYIHMLKGKESLGQPVQSPCVYSVDIGLCHRFGWCCFPFNTTISFLEHLPCAHAVIKSYGGNMCFSALPSALWCKFGKGR